MFGRRVALVRLPFVLLASARNAWAGGNNNEKDLLERLSLAEQSVRELITAFEVFKKSAVRHEGLISNLSRTSPSVGSVMAFAGEWPPARGEDGHWTEAELGWLLCDGRKFEALEKMGLSVNELRSVLHEDLLPNYQGYFLRGVGTDRQKGEDPDAVNRKVGSIQLDTTRMPRSEAFRTKVDGAHQHWCPTGGGRDTAEAYEVPSPHRKDRYDFGYAAPTEWAQDQPDNVRFGAHQHKIEGGDYETRPRNIAVYWIIKFR